MNLNKPSSKHDTSSRFSRPLQGFTLVELLVVIAIIGVLISLLLPAIQAAREAARKSQCVNNLKQLGIALHNYESINSGLPAGSGYLHEQPKGNWVVAVMPFMEQLAIFTEYDFSKYPDESPNLELAERAIIPSLICPSDEAGNNPILENRRQGVGSHNPLVAQGLWYTGSMGPTIPDRCEFAPTSLSPATQEQYRLTCAGCGYGTVNPATGKPLQPCARGHNPNDSDSCAGLICRRHEGTPFRSVTDGLSNTIMAGETLPGHWIWNCVFCDNFPVSSTHIPLNTMESRSTATEHWLVSGFKSTHPGGAHFVMGDGSVHFLSESIDYVTYNVLGSRANGEIPLDIPY